MNNEHDLYRVPAVKPKRLNAVRVLSYVFALFGILSLAISAISLYELWRNPANQAYMANDLFYGSLVVVNGVACFWLTARIEEYKRRVWRVALVMCGLWFGAFAWEIMRKSNFKYSWLLLVPFVIGAGLYHYRGYFSD